MSQIDKVPSVQNPQYIVTLGASKCLEPWSNHCDISAHVVLIFAPIRSSYVGPDTQSGAIH